MVAPTGLGGGGGETATSLASALGLPTILDLILSSHPPLRIWSISATMHLVQVNMCRNRDRKRVLLELDLLSGDQFAEMQQTSSVVALCEGQVERCCCQGQGVCGGKRRRLAARCIIRFGASVSLNPGFLRARLESFSYHSSEASFMRRR